MFVMNKFHKFSDQCIVKIQILFIHVHSLTGYQLHFRLNFPKRSEIVE